ncbi:MAG: dihydrofolate reductase, partial [Sphingomicrobium sp.]
MAYLSLVVAFDAQRGIGVDNKLPWHLPRDLRRFRELTLERPVIMGRRTFESIGKPLPRRV